MIFANENAGVRKIMLCERVRIVSLASKRAHVDLAAWDVLCSAKPSSLPAGKLGSSFLCLSYFLDKGNFLLYLYLDATDALRVATLQNIDHRQFDRLVWRSEFYSCDMMRRHR